MFIVAPQPKTIGGGWVTLTGGYLVAGQSGMESFAFMWIFVISVHP
jgi:hypothetical protein